MKKTAIQLINKAHSEDPNQITVDYEQFPAELVYADRCVEWLFKLNPEPTELQEIAVRCQHFKRWEIPRDSYPMDKKGYHQWRIYLYNYQAEEAAKVLRQAGYLERDIDFVKNMVSKKDLRNNEDTQLIEDVACLTFLEFYMQPFAASKTEYSEEKWIKIIQKTWNKMSDKAHDLALTQIKYTQEIFELINKALS